MLDVECSISLTTLKCEHRTSNSQHRTSNLRICRGHPWMPISVVHRSAWFIQPDFSISRRSPSATICDRLSLWRFANVSGSFSNPRSMLTGTIFAPLPTIGRPARRATVSDRFRIGTFEDEPHAEAPRRKEVPISALAGLRAAPRRAVARDAKRIARHGLTLRGQGSRATLKFVAPSRANISTGRVWDGRRR